MPTTAGTPTQADATSNALDSRDIGFRDDPHRMLDRLRIDCPVHQDRASDRVVLTRAADIQDVLTDRSLSADPFKARPTAFARRGLDDAERGRHSMVFLDDPDHARLRGLVAQAFSARAVDAMRPRIASIAETLLDGIDTSKPFDLVAEYATPLPIIVITEMLGVRDADVESFRLWSDQTKLFFDPERTEETNAVLWSAIANLNACLADVVAERRRSGDDDLISGLVAAEASGSRLTDTEIVDTCRALLVAGNITTADLIGTGLVSLLRHPDQLDAVRQEPRRWPHAIEEMLRHDAPVTAWNRQALDDRTIDGCRIEAGQTITSMLAAANHDPSIHADPHRFDIARDGQRHFSFGGGSHFCLGASLARLEAQIAMASLVSRFPRLALTRDRPERKTQPGFSGYAAVWLTAA